MRSYGTITVEMKRKNPDVSLQWSNLQTYLRGLPFIEKGSSMLKIKGESGTIAQDLIAPFTTKTAGGGNGEGEY